MAFIIVAWSLSPLWTLAANAAPDAPDTPDAPVAIPAPPDASDGDIQEAIESYLRATVPDPDTYEPLDFSGMVLFAETESTAYKWGMRHTYRVGHPQYGVLYVDRIFFIAYDGQVESIIEYTRRPCIDCKW